MTDVQQRRLAAILAADVVGYTRLIEDDEGATLQAMRGHLTDVIEPKITEHGGRLVKLMGDGLLAEFPSAVEAVKSAIDIQVLIAHRNLNVVSERKILFRIGINIGDVVVDDDDIFGDGVNLAARLEQLSRPGEICISLNVRDQIRDKLPVTIEDQGEIAVKNVSRPVRVFAVPIDENASTFAKGVKEQKKRTGNRRDLIRLSGVIGIVLAVSIAVLAWLIPSVSRMEKDAVGVQRKPSIAVLPFESLSEGSDNEYFAEGLTDDLITDLSKVSGLLVIARESSFAYGPGARETSAIASELGVRYVLDGSVRRSDTFVRINARLIDSQDGDLVWAERFDRSYQNIFAIQDEVIAGIVEALSLQLTEAEQIEVARMPTDNLEAYDYYLRAENLAYHSKAGTVGEALRMYQKAISLDASFAEAYAGYARVAVDLLHYGFFDNLPSAVARKRAYEAASRASQLNPGLARSYSVLALLQMLDGEHDSAVFSASEAIKKSPNDAEAHLNLAVVLIYSGRHGDALREIETVLRLNPKPPNYVREYQALAHYLDGNYQKALELVEPLSLADLGDLGLEVLAGANARSGRETDANAAVTEMLTRLPEASLAGFRFLYQHHANPEDLDFRIKSLRLAGMTKWPHGFTGDVDLQLSEGQLDMLIKAQSWVGSRVGVGPMFRYIDANGSFIERGRSYQYGGIVERRGRELCSRSDALVLGRSTCGPVFFDPDADPETSYNHPSGMALYTFGVDGRPQ